MQIFLRNTYEQAKYTGGSLGLIPRCQIRPRLSNWRMRPMWPNLVSCKVSDFGPNPASCHFPIFFHFFFGELQWASIETQRRCFGNIRGWRICSQPGTQLLGDLIEMFRDFLRIIRQKQDIVYQFTIDNWFDYSKIINLPQMIWWFNDFYPKTFPKICAIFRPFGYHRASEIRLGHPPSSRFWRYHSEGTGQVAGWLMRTTQ